MTDDAAHTDAPTAAAGLPDWATAAQRVRDTAATLIKTFAALATVLIGSAPLLANLDNLHADSRGLLALSAAAVGLLGVGFIIWQAADVNLTEVTDISDLLDGKDEVITKLIRKLEVEPARDHYLGGLDLAGVIEDRKANIKSWQQNSQALTQSRDANDVGQYQALISGASKNIATDDAILANVAGWANYERIRAKFDTARKKMFVAGAVAVIGVVVWLGLASTSSPTTPTVVGSTPPAGSTIGTLVWQSAGTHAPDAKRLRRQLHSAGDSAGPSMANPSCTTIGVLNLGGSGSELDPWELIALPGSACPVRLRFSVTSDLASFTPTSLGDEIIATVTVHHSPSVYNIVLYVVLGVLAGTVLGFFVTHWFRR